MQSRIEPRPQNQDQIQDESCEDYEPLLNVERIQLILTNEDSIGKTTNFLRTVMFKNCNIKRFHPQSKLNENDTSPS